jgi:hypothetical protein
MCAFVPGVTFFWPVRLPACVDTWKAAFVPLTARQMNTFEVYGPKDANGGMRFAFPPYAYGLKWYHLSKEI